MERTLHLDDIISKIPSLDSDLSSVFIRRKKLKQSDNEEEISIPHQRPSIHSLEVTNMDVEVQEVKFLTYQTDDDQKGDHGCLLPVSHNTRGSVNERVQHKTESDLPANKSKEQTRPLDTWDQKQDKSPVKLIQANALKGHDNEMHENDLMEQLIAFCERKVNEMEIKPFKIHNMQQPSIRANGRDDPAQLSLNQDSPTIYIDLRQNEILTAISRSNSVINPVNLDQEISIKRTTNTIAKATGQKREVIGTSLLFQNSRQPKQSMSESCCRHPQDFAESRQKNSPGKSIKEKQIHDFETCCSQPNIQQVNACSSASKYDQNSQSSHNPAAVNKHREHHDHKVRCEKELMHLQTFRPQRSANNRDEAAERTDILYDPEASYLPSVKTLPVDIQKKECLLLTVSLTGPGVVTGRAQRKAQTVDPVLIKSHTYNALIAWFMSLNDPTIHMGRGKKFYAPFWVAGLQQLHMEDGLVLYISAVSLEDGPTGCRKYRMKGVKKDKSMFYRRVCKFFAQTSLKTVAFWVPQLNNFLGKQAYPSFVHLPASNLECFISVNPNPEAVEKVFSVVPGFYWQTLETGDQKCKRAEAINSQECHTETALVLIGRELFLNPLAMHYTLELMCRSCLDVCGIRFLYPPQELLTNFGVIKSVMHGGEDAHQPVLIMAFRGAHTNSVWQEITGPSDLQLARRTDPQSINAHYHCSQDQALLYSPRLANRVHLGLCLFFGGRIEENTLSMIQDSGETEDGCSHILTSSPATLCATVKADIFLLVSPVVRPRCYSHILCACAKTGFSLLGLQRVQLSRGQAQFLGLTTKQVAAFCHAPTVFLDGEQVELSSHCLVLLMRRESAVRYSSRLPLGLMNVLAVRGLIGSNVDGPDVCFHTIPYSKNHHNILGGFMWTFPDCSHMVLSKHTYPSCPDAEQVVILTLTGQNIMENEINFLQKVLRGDPAGQEGFELLALKWVPKLSRRQAQELSPFEIGNREWQNSVQILTSAPALVLALRRVRAFITLRQLLQHNYPGNLSVLMSPTSETAFRQTCLFFSESELIPDHSSRSSLKFQPLHHIDTPGLRSQSLYSYMTVGPEPLLTLALFKPGVWRHCFGKILTLIKQSGYTLVGLRTLLMDSDLAKALISPTKKQDPTEELEYLTSGPSLALGLLRVNAVMRLWELMGSEDPVEARAVDQTLWRARFGSDRLHNGIYGSPSYKKAIEDIKLLFPNGVCCTETFIMRYEQIPSLRSDPDACLDRAYSHMPLKKLASEFGQGPLLCAALCQTTCLLIPSSLLQQSQPPLISELLQRLLRTGCHLLAGKLCVLDNKQRHHVSELLRSSAGEALLCEGPWLIIALQADNAVTCFDIILERVCRERPDFRRVTRKLLYPNSESKALKLLCYLFEDLGLDGHHSTAP